MNNNKKFEGYKNIENFDAITDKMVMNYIFLAEILNEKNDIDKVLQDSGFKLTGEAKSLFYQFVKDLRTTTKDILLGNCETSLQL